MKAILGAYMMMGLNMMNDMKTQSKQRKKEILAEWERSKNCPRKKKKRVRKELQVNWSIANWDPFGEMFNF
jgi:hypothetical protein